MSGFLYTVLERYRYPKFLLSNCKYYIILFFFFFMPQISSLPLPVDTKYLKAIMMNFSTAPVSSTNPLKFTTGICSFFFVKVTLKHTSYLASCNAMQLSYQLSFETYWTEQFATSTSYHIDFIGVMRLISTLRSSPLAHDSEMNM